MRTHWNNFTKCFAFALVSVALPACGDRWDMERDGLPYEEPADCSAALRGTATGADGFEEVGVLSASGGRQLCTGVLISPDAILTTQSCAARKPSHFSTKSQGNRMLPSWSDKRKVLARVLQAPDRDGAEGRESLAIIFVESRATDAKHAELDMGAPMHEGQRLWVAGFGSSGEALSPFSHRTRRYAGGRVIGTSADESVLEVDSTEGVCRDDVGAGVFTEDGNSQRSLVGIIVGVAANPGGSGTPRGCSRRAKVLSLHGYQDWIGSTMRCAHRCGQFAALPTATVPGLVPRGKVTDWLRAC